MEHLSLEIFDLTGSGSKYATLPENTTITITETSEIFASGDVWSYGFTLNVYANAHIFGTAGDMHGSRLHEQINKRRARLWVEGIPLYLGYLRLEDEVEVDEEGNVEVSFESGQKTFDEMIEGAKANQVPLMSDVRIGMAQWRKRKVKCWLKLTASVTFDDGKISDPIDVIDTRAHGHENTEALFTTEGEEEGEAAQEYPRMVFPKGAFKDVNTGTVETVDCVNTDYPYDDGHPYCNIALCYQKYGYEKKNTDGSTYNDYSAEPEAMRGYEEMPANRVNSAPNFYVIYWIRSLMKHLGIYIEENQMMEVEDLRRLFFVNTRCAYEEPDNLRTGTYDSRYGKYRLFDSEQGRFADKRLVAEYVSPIKLIKAEECGLQSTDDTQIGTPTVTGGTLDPSEIPTIEKVNVAVKSVVDLTATEKNDYERDNSYLHNAYATSECFPDVDISEVIKAIENGFGVRFLFSDNYQRVRIVLLRNIFQNQEVQHITCDIISESKTENSIRGFRMTYGNTEDTHYYYKGFADKLPHKTELWRDTSDNHDYSHWSLNAVYANIIQKASAFDKTCYVTPETGNAYGVKIDKDAKRYDELHPSLFEYAGFMDAEDGDCTGEEETIKTINVGFKPAIMNDLNMEEERGGTQTQRFALFLDDAMRPRRPDLQDGTDYNDADAIYDVDGKLYAKEDNKYVYGDMMVGEIVKPGEFAITSDMTAAASGLQFDIHRYFIRYPFQIKATWHIDLAVAGHINEGYRLYLQDNYEPNDNGAAPIESHDWGLTLGVMRGSGSDAYVDYGADNQDGEGNDTWEIMPGSSATSHPDTCDNYGREWDYNDMDVVSNNQAALDQMTQLFPDSNFDLTNRNESTYISGLYLWQTYVSDGNGNLSLKYLLFAESTGSSNTKTYTGQMKDYAKKFMGMTAAEMRTFDAGSQGFGILIDTDSTNEKRLTLLELQRRAFLSGANSDPMYIDDGVGSRYGRLSLKLRAEKPNPDFDASLPESAENPRYLSISNGNLQGRGLLDKFYKAYSYWERNARIAKRTVNIGLAELLAIDKTKKATVGDITGFIRKKQYTVSNETGLGVVTMEIMYI